MRNVWTIASREYRHYFSTPTAYAITFLILLALGLWFFGVLYASVQQQFAPGVQIILGPLAVFMMLATPPITTRLLAEEQRLGTLELLLTAPVRDWELVVGKWLGSFLLLLTIVAITWIYPLVLNMLVQPGIDQGQLVAGYLGVILLCATLIAIGVAISSLFANPVAAFVTSMGVFVVFWWIIAPVTQALGPVGNSFLSYLDLSGHFYSNLYQGVIDLKDVVYFLSVTSLALFLSSVSVEMRRWR